MKHANIKSEIKIYKIKLRKCWIRKRDIPAKSEIYGHLDFFSTKKYYNLKNRICMQICGIKRELITSSIHVLAYRKANLIILLLINDCF